MTSTSITIIGLNIPKWICKDFNFGHINVQLTKTGFSSSLAQLRIACSKPFILLGAQYASPAQDRPELNSSFKIPPRVLAWSGPGSKNPDTESIQKIHSTT